MPLQFVSKPIEPKGGFAGSADGAHGEPVLPAAFHFNGEELVVQSLVRSWRSTKDDRGDTYLKRHWYEVEIDGGRRAVVYFDRGARRNEPRWWLYTLMTA